MIKQFSDLPEQQVQEICEAFAIRGGALKITEEITEAFGLVKTYSSLSCDWPDYPNDKNAMGRIIEGMDDNTITEYSMNLYCVDGTMDGKLKATARQQFVAAALASGLIKEDGK